MENAFLVLKSNFESDPIRSISILFLFISYFLMKMRGGLIYPLSNSGRSILDLVKFASQRYELNRSWSIWNVFNASDHSIVLTGMINGTDVELIFSNKAMNELNVIKNASNLLNSNIKQAFAGKMTVIKKTKGKETSLISQNKITHDDLVKFLSV